MNIYFWQRILTPHMTAIATALSKSGYRVIYIAEKPLSKDRIKLGWEVQKTQNIQVIYVNNYSAARLIVHNAPKDSIHICQGLRKNGVVSYAQKELRKKKLRQWIIMETINDKGFIGIFKRILYRFLIFFYQYLFCNKRLQTEFFYNCHKLLRLLLQVYFHAPLR
jgi:hypothetical protein